MDLRLKFTSTWTISSTSSSTSRWRSEVVCEPEGAPGLKFQFPLRAVRLRVRRAVRHDLRPVTCREGIRTGSMTTLQRRTGKAPETQSAIVHNQREILRDELRRIEEKNEGRFSKIGQTLQDHERKFEDIAKSIHDLQQRLPVDGDATSTAASTMSKHQDERLTVVVGGWPRDTKRQQILSKLSKLVQDLELADSLDRDPFVTGARRSFALIPFHQRWHERRDDCRDRMYTVINRIMQAKVTLPSQDRPLWAAVSKTPMERAKAQHCNLVRNLVKFFSPNKVQDLECEYGRGVVWLGDHQLSDATVACTVTDAKLWHDTSKDNKPWINIGAVSLELQADPEEILDFLRKQKEGL